MMFTDGFFQTVMPALAIRTGGVEHPQKHPSRTSPSHIVTTFDCFASGLKQYSELTATLTKCIVLRRAVVLSSSSFRRITKERQYTVTGSLVTRPKTVQHFLDTVQSRMVL